MLVSFVILWLTYAAALWVASELQGGIFLQGLRNILMVALIFAVLNQLAHLLMPVGILSVLTLGVFSVVLNAALLMLTDWVVQNQDRFVIYFAVGDWLDALVGGIIITVIGFLIGLFVDPHRLARRVAH